SRIEVIVPEAYADRMVEFIAELEQLKTMSDQKAVVVVNERTGTIVAGSHVLINPVAITHAQISIEIGASQMTLQAPKAKAETPQVSIGALAQTLTSFGVSPREFMGILEALRAAGALHADIRQL